MKYAINATGVDKPDGYYSQATTCGRFIFISGQTGCRKRAQAQASEEAPARTGEDALGVREEFAAQLDEIMQTFTRILAEVNCTREDIAELSIQLVSLDLVPLLDELMPSYFGLPAPARTLFVVQSLPAKALIQISCTACR